MSGLIKVVKAIKKADGLILTPRVAEYLATHNATVINEETADVIKDIMMDGSNNVRHSRFGASSRGTCHRQQVFKFLGMPAQLPSDPILHNVFHDGTWRHMRWQAVGLQEGWFTHVEVPAKKKSLRLSISLDAINDEEGWLFELKGAWRIPETVPREHLLQIHTYFLVTGYDVCVYLVEHKQTQDWKEFIVRKDPAIMQAVRKELDALNYAIEERDLPAYPQAAFEKTRKGKPKEEPCKSCPFQEGCFEQGEHWPRRDSNGFFWGGIRK